MRTDLQCYLSPGLLLLATWWRAYTSYGTWNREDVNGDMTPLAFLSGKFLFALSIVTSALMWAFTNRLDNWSSGCKVGWLQVPQPSAAGTALDVLWPLAIQGRVQKSCFSTEFPNLLHSLVFTGSHDLRELDRYDLFSLSNEPWVLMKVIKQMKLILHYIHLLCCHPQSYYGKCWSPSSQSLPTVHGLILRHNSSDIITYLHHLKTLINILFSKLIYSRWTSLDKVI